MSWGTKLVSTNSVIEIIFCILKDHGLKLKFNSKRNYRKYTNSRRLNSTLLRNDWVPEEFKIIYTFLELNENSHNILKPMRYNECSPFSSNCSCDKIKRDLKTTTMRHLKAWEEQNKPDLTQ